MVSENSGLVGIKFDGILEFGFKSVVNLVLLLNKENLFICNSYIRNSFPSGWMVDTC